MAPEFEESHTQSFALWHPGLINRPSRLAFRRWYHCRHFIVWYMILFYTLISNIFPAHPWIESRVSCLVPVFSNEEMLHGCPSTNHTNSLFLIPVAWQNFCNSQDLEWPISWKLICNNVSHEHHDIDSIEELIG